MKLFGKHPAKTKLSKRIPPIPGKKGVKKKLLFRKRSGYNYLPYRRIGYYISRRRSNTSSNGIHQKKAHVTLDTSSEAFWILIIVYPFIFESISSTNCSFWKKESPTWYMYDAWSQKIASGGRFWNVVSDAWFWNIAPEMWFQNIVSDASQMPTRRPPDSTRCQPDASQMQLFKIRHQAPARCQPDARQMPAIRNVLKSAVRCKISKSCIRRYFLWPCVRCAARVQLCNIICGIEVHIPEFLVLKH